MSDRDSLQSTSEGWSWRNTEVIGKGNGVLPVALTAEQPAFVLYIELYFYRPAHAHC